MSKVGALAEASGAAGQGLWCAGGVADPGAREGCRHVTSLTFCSRELDTSPSHLPAAAGDSVPSLFSTRAGEVGQANSCPNRHGVQGEGDGGYADAPSTTHSGEGRPVRVAAPPRLHTRRGRIFEGQAPFQLVSVSSKESQLKSGES